jgi:hypothetical protein
MQAGHSRFFNEACSFSSLFKTLFTTIGELCVDGLRRPTSADLLKVFRGGRGNSAFLPLPGGSPDWQMDG